MTRLGVSLCVLMLAQPTYSHHSSVGIYDMERNLEIEGVVTSVRWQNPHASYTVDVLDENGEAVEWFVETGSVSALRLRGLEPDIVEVGDQVRFAGEASLRGRAEMFARNLLLANGQEALLSARSEPRWPEGLSGNLFTPPVDEARGEEARRSATGIFRVWATVLGDPDSFPLYREGVYPLTESARELKAQWNPRTSPYLGCGQKGAPYVMTTVYPLEFVRQGDDILLRLEEADVERLINMNASSSASLDTYSLRGYSTGRWEGETLIVETEKIDSPYFYGDGTPQSRAIQLTEHFWLNEAEDRLNYRLFVTDPETFTEPLEFTRYWAWRPDLRVESYNCVE